MRCIHFFFQFKQQLLKGYNLGMGRIVGYKNYLQKCEKIQSKIEKLQSIKVQIDSLVSLSDENLKLNTSLLEQLPQDRIFILKDEKIKLFEKFKKQISNFIKISEKQTKQVEYLENSRIKAENFRGRSKI